MALSLVSAAVNGIVGVLLLLHGPTARVDRPGGRRQAPAHRCVDHGGGAAGPRSGAIDGRRVVRPDRRAADGRLHPVDRGGPDGTLVRWSDGSRIARRRVGPGTKGDRDELGLGMTYHALRTRQAGSRRFVEFHLLVPGVLSVRQAHAADGSRRGGGAGHPSGDGGDDPRRADRGRRYEDSALRALERAERREVGER